jgi:hypothetical protein
LEVKFVPSNSPSDAPNPVKSNRSTATPKSASASLILDAARNSFEQVKQWAKIA